VDAAYVDAELPVASCRGSGSTCPAHRGRTRPGGGASLRHLPPYSPDLDPIEQAWAKLKALLRKAAGRTVQG